MPFPKTDTDLLKHYHKGECTPEEIRQVALWLEADDDIEASFPEDHLTVIEDRVWEKIKPQTTITSRIKQLAIPMGIAAGLVIAFYLFTSKKIDGGPVEQTYSLTQLKSGSLKVQGLNFRLVGEGNATVFSGLGKQNGNMTFCGVVEISNNSSQDVNYVLNYGCGMKDIGQKRKFLLKKGKTYIAMSDHLNTDEVIVMRKEHLIEFPDMMPTGVERI